jgi:hypothetical protein
MDRGITGSVTTARSTASKTRPNPASRHFRNRVAFIAPRQERMFGAESVRDDTSALDRRPQWSAESGGACSSGRGPDGIPHPARPIRVLSACVWTRSSSCSGVYLLVSPVLGPNDPVAAVGWARNDYWAVQIWGFDGYGYRNEYDPLEAAADTPSLESLGWPNPLSYAKTLAHAKRRSDRPVTVNAAYRMTDGGFTSHVIQAADRVEFHYDDPNPQPSDTVAAIELGLVGIAGNNIWPRFARSTAKTNVGARNV